MSDQPRKALSLFDSTSLIMGIIIGTGIFVMVSEIASGTSSWWQLLLLWLAGGTVSLFGAFGYAELGTMYPKEGGDYVYLTKAYGPWAGFLFGWMQLVVVRPGDIAVMAFSFALFAREIFTAFGIPLEMLGSYSLPYLESPIVLGEVLLACGAVVILSMINIIGVHEGKWTQNFLTIAKVIGLLMIIGVAFLAPTASHQSTPEEFEGIPLRLALIFVLFTFGGWNEMAYVAAEVKDARRNIVRALVLGVVAVTTIYLIFNAALLFALGHQGLASSSETVVTDVVSEAFPGMGGRLIAALICISALGAVNGLIFTGARISYAVGTEHRIFRKLGRWNLVTGTPVAALVVQAVISCVLIFLLGSLIEAIIYTSSAVYTFYFATNFAVIVLRWKDRDTERPYRVTGFPVTTLIFCAVCLLLIHAALTFLPLIGLAAFLLSVIGLGIFQFLRRPLTAIPHAMLLVASLAFFRHIWVYYQAHQHKPDEYPYPWYSWVGIVVGFLLLVLYQLLLKDTPRDDSRNRANLESGDQPADSS